MAKFISRDGKLNVGAYNKIVDGQNKVFANIDWAMATLHQLPTLIDSVLSLRGVAIPNALDYVFKLLNALGLSEEEMRDLISKIITVVLPAAEVGIKATLLANLKASASCNADPMIPKQMRRLVTKDYYRDLYDAALSSISEERGVLLSTQSIDPFGVLSMSPFTDPGSSKYFDCVETVKETEADEKTGKVRTVGYKKVNVPIDTLARAVDFNAFMWYVMHNGQHTSPFQAKVQGSLVKINGKTYELMDGAKDIMTGYVKLKVDGDDCEIIQGATLIDIDNPRVLMLCIRRDEPHGTSQNMVLHIVPVAPDWASCNWYANKNWYRFKYTTDSNGESLGFSRRDFTQDKPICNIRYITHSDVLNEMRNKVDLAQNLIRNPEVFSQTTNGFRVTVLPKPAIFTSYGTSEEWKKYKEELKSYNEGKLTNKPSEPMVHRYIKLLFNEKGEYDKNGSYSVNGEDGSPVTLEGLEGSYRVYKINGTNCKFKVSSTVRGSYKFEGSATDIKKVLVECYKGLTVYEFNYDFIMGIKLFDAKTIIGSLFDAAKNSTFAFNFTKVKDKNSYTYAAMQQRITDIVWDTLANDEEVNDCFYNFSNEDYDAKLQESEQRRMRKSIYGNDYTKSNDLDLSEAYKILDDYPSTGTLQEQKDNIDLALKVACAAVQSSIDDTARANSSSWAGLSEFSSSNTSFFLTNILRNLAFALIEQILSPKVMTVFAMNRKMMGEINEDAFKWSARDLEQLSITLIKPILLEVKDMIVQEILDFIISKLTELITALYAEIAKEKLSAYLALLKLLLGWFAKGVQYVNGGMALSSFFKKYFKSKFGSNGDSDIELPSILDDVTYADIYADEINAGETPIFSNC